MNQVEVKSKQVQALISVLGAVTWLILGSMVGDNGITYFAVAAEGFLFFYYLLAGRLPESLGRLLRSRYQKGQFKNADKIKSSVLIFQILLGVLGSVLLFFLAPVLMEKVFLIPYGTLALRILAPVLIIRVVINIFLGYFQGSGTQMPTVTVHLLRHLFYLGFTFLFVGMLRDYGEKVSLLLLNDMLPFMYGAAGMAVAVAVTELLLLLAVVFLYFVSRKSLQKQSEGLKKTETFSGAVGSLYSTMSPMILQDLLLCLPIWLGMIFYFRSAEDAQSALISYGKYYGKYLVICMIPVLVGGMLLHSLAVRTARAVSKGERRYAKELLGAGFHMGVVISMFPVIFLASLSTQVSHMIEGTKGAPGELGRMFLVGSAVIVLAVISLFFVRCILYMGKQNMVIASLGLYVIVFIICAAVCLNLLKLGIESLIYGSLVSLFVLSFSVGIGLFRHLRLKMDVLYWIGIPVLASAASGLICYLSGKFVTPHMGYPFTVILGFVIGLAVYWFILLFFKSFHRKELEVISGGRMIEYLLELLGR